MANAAIQLNFEAYDASGPRPMGRHSAGEGFLRGFLRHADVDRIHLWNVEDRDPAELQPLIERLGPPGKPLAWLGRGDRASLAGPGALHLPNPLIADEAWARRAFGGHAYSLTGVTHTIAEAQILDELGTLLIAPLEPWDALVCTSNSTRNAVEMLINSVAVHVTERFGAARIPPVQLVTIPLGVDTAALEPRPDARRRWRERLDIPQDAPVALFVGRFDAATKMQPGPMGIALQQASQRLGAPVWWILYGGAQRAQDEAAFREAAAAFCPDVRLAFVDHASASDRDAILSAADVFLSLSDNIQETFGLTPVEAMAAGLPCVVSDWNGYRDTVRHGVDGFRIPTITPRPGLGSDLIYAYAQRLMPYEAYAGAVSALTAVDVVAAAEALAALFADPQLRARMGEAGQTRARETFDWGVIIPQYQALWTELGRRRAAAPVQPGLENPYRPDPFRMFASYPTTQLAAADQVALAGPVSPADLRALLDHPTVRSEAARLPDTDEILLLLSLLTAGPRTVGDLMTQTTPERRPFVERALVWLAKYGVLRLGVATPRT